MAAKAALPLQMFGRRLVQLRSSLDIIELFDTQGALKWKQGNRLRLIRTHGKHFSNFVLQFQRSQKTDRVFAAFSSYKLTLTVKQPYANGDSKSRQKQQTFKWDGMGFKRIALEILLPACIRKHTETSFSCWLKIIHYSRIIFINTTEINEPFFRIFIILQNIWKNQVNIPIISTYFMCMSASMRVIYV